MPKLALFMLIACVALFIAAPPSHAFERSVELQPPFYAEDGAAFKARTPEWLTGDSVGASRGSSIRLFEDGKPLGPAHTAHNEIRAKGSGRFSHWGNELYFSTSDGTNPNANARHYELRYPWTIPAILYLLGAGMFFVIVLALVGRGWVKLAGQRRGVRVTGIVAIQLLAAVAMLETAAWILTSSRLANASDHERRLYGELFEGKPERRESDVSLYMPHPFLNFALNPQRNTGGRREVDPDYLIRRHEPLRPRTEVAWRALVLGGSTTYGEFLPDEADTWVHRLEAKVRTKLGRSNVEVINGGVSAYTIVDNLIHYSLLLSRLEPDVVLLYIGINDVQPRWHAKLRPDYANFRKPWAGSVLPAVDPLLSRSWTYRGWYLWRHVWGSRGIHIGNLVAYPEPAIETRMAGLDRNGPGIYRSHLETLVRLIRSQGSKVIVLPQYFRPRGPADEALARGVTEHNVVNREVAEQLGATYAAEVVAPGQFVEGDCFDNCHFNAEGSEKMAAIVLEVLGENGLLPDH